MPEIKKPARIILEDGTEFEGTSFGHESSTAGEIVWYAGMADMARALSEPALQGTIVVFSQPIAGATGIPDERADEYGLDLGFESLSSDVAGIVVADYTDDASHWSAGKSLGKWLKRRQVPGIYGVDTRALIQRISARGSMRAKVIVSDTKEVTFSSAAQHNPIVAVSTKRVVQYGTGARRIALVDCGARNSTIRSLVARDVSVVRVPHNHDYLKEEFDGIVVAGGPGDPTSCERAIEILRDALKLRKPIFAVGQGAVILAIAAGASAFRMAQGHRGPAVPCVDLASGRCYLTSQCHGYGVRDDSLPSGWTPSFLNNNDRSIEGFSAEKGLFSGMLFQPEGYPGPHEADYLYANFLDIVRNGGIIQ
jgi:carbamoyl-phosphate synthase small subunit